MRTQLAAALLALAAPLHATEVHTSAATNPALPSTSAATNPGLPSTSSAAPTVTITFINPGSPSTSSAAPTVTITFINPGSPSPSSAAPPTVTSAATNPGLPSTASTVTSAATNPPLPSTVTTLTTVSRSTNGTVSHSATGKPGPTSSVVTGGAAAPLGVAMQGGMLALIAGVAAVLA